MAETDLIPMWWLLAAALALLAPWGLVLIFASALPEGEARQAALTPLAAFTLALVGYLATGFALHYGGIGLKIDHADLNALIWEWSALSEEWGSTWGMAGLAGFFLRGAATPVVYALFLSALPWATMATLLPMAALRGRAPAVVVAVFGVLTAFIVYPVVGNWVQGGGWLANLGFNLGLGHGYVDFGGASLFLLGGGVILAGILIFLRREPRSAGPRDLPPIHLPLLAIVGIGLLLVGSTGWLLGGPLTDWTQVIAPEAVVHALLAAAGGGLASLVYTWFVANHPDPLLGARGVVAGWVAGLAAAPFVSPAAALLIGLVGGLLMVLTTYVVDHRLRLQDPGGLLAMCAVPALWGILAVGFFADGSAGAGYNGVGLDEYLGIAGQGVTGLFAGQGFVADRPGQFLAQAIGAAVVFLLGFLLTSLLAVPLTLVARAWGGRADVGGEKADALYPPPADGHPPVSDNP